MTKLTERSGAKFGGRRCAGRASLPTRPPWARSVVALGLVVAAGMLAGANAAAEAHWEEPSALIDLDPCDGWRLEPGLSIGFDYSDGDFGERGLDEYLSIPFTPRLDWGPFSLSLTLPIDRVTIDVVDCSSARFPSLCERDVGRAAQPTTRIDAWGLGDIYLDLAATWIPESPWLPAITPFTSVKFPSGDASRGLGTGSYDFTSGADVSWVIDDFIVFGSAGYTARSEPTVFLLEDYAFAGGGLAWMPRSWGGISAGYDWRGRAATGLDDAHSVSTSIWLDLSRHVQVEPYGVFGVAGSAPDLGVGFSVRLAW